MYKPIVLWSKMCIIKVNVGKSGGKWGKPLKSTTFPEFAGRKTRVKGEL